MIGRELFALTVCLWYISCGVCSGQNPPTPVAKPRSYPPIKLNAGEEREPTETEKGLQENFERIFQRIKRQEPMDPDNFFRATINEEVVESRGLRFSGVYVDVTETPSITNIVYEFLLAPEAPGKAPPKIKGFNLVSADGKIRSSLRYKVIIPSERLKENFPDCSPIYSFMTRPGFVKPDCRYALWVALESDEPAIMGCRVTLPGSKARRTVDEEDWTATYEKIEVSKTGKSRMWQPRFLTAEESGIPEEEIRMRVKVKIPSPVPGDFIFLKAATEGQTSAVKTAHIKAGANMVKTFGTSEISIGEKSMFKKQNPKNEDESVTILRIPGAELPAGEYIEFEFNKGTSKAKSLWYGFNFIGEEDTNLSGKLLLAVFK